MSDGRIDPALVAQLAEVAQLLTQAALRLTSVIQTLNKPAAATATTPIAAAPSADVNYLPKYLTTKQAASALGLSTKGLEALRARGDGPPYLRVGRAVRYPSDTLGATRPAGRRS